VNLASDEVLQALETALDNKEVILVDDTSATKREEPIPQHPEFRLFATQVLLCVCLYSAEFKKVVLCHTASCSLCLRVHCYQGLLS
jgi:hypothetical protein